MKKRSSPRFTSVQYGLPFSRLVRQIPSTLSLLVAILTLLSPKFAYAQSGFCIFNEALEQVKDDHPEVFQILESNEELIQDVMHDNPQAIMNNTVYTIPVVFHVVHLGESVGSGSNISDALLLQGLDDLNYYFRDVLNTGTDVEIEFCLAQRDPAGALSTGINRINGYGVGNYENIGIAPGGNEVDVKSLSIWPNTDYLNIWIVHEIAGGSTLGFAYFPGAPASLDGIVIRYDAIGVSGNSGVIVHEAGHFLNLFHTFEGGTTTTCPPNTYCDFQGDRICDTDPHQLVYGGCDDTSPNVCNGSAPIGAVAHNHMNYTDNSCRNEFTPDQVMRMRSALMILRPTLMYSLGCEPGCNDVTAGFTVTSNDVQIGTPVTFTNTSTPTPSSNSWLIDGHQISTLSNLTYTFTDGGVYQVCLDATLSGCTNRFCETITANPLCYPPTDPCEWVFNGDFEQILSGATASTDFEDVCGWNRAFSSPFYCNQPDNNAVGLWVVPGDEERIISEFPLSLEPDKECTISFDYLITGYFDPALNPMFGNNSVDNLIISLTDPPANDNEMLPSTANIIAQVNNPPLSYIDQPNHECYLDNVGFLHYSGTFTYNGDGKLYLNASGTAFTSVPPPAMYPNPIIAFIDNISINCCGDGSPTCNPEPDFDYEQDICSVTFTGSSTGDEGEYHWDFGDGTTGTGANVTHDYIFGGTFTVCLTIICEDMETSATICKEITIPNDCNECEELDPVRATLCEESELTPNTYLANFCFQVPKGFKACKPDKLFVTSWDVNIAVNSYEIDDSNISYDEICVAITITPPNGYNFSSLGATGYITLCDDEGLMICREFAIVPQVCDNCLDEIHSDALCDDPNLSDNNHIYEGSVSFTLPNGATPCGWNSPLVGFEVLSATAPPGLPNQTWTVTYRITTTNINLMHTTALLCFYNATELKQYCIPLDITIIPCRLPDDCVAAWTPKNMTCTDTENGEYVFNIQKQVYAGPYSLCAGGLFGTVDGGGTVHINNASVNLNVLTFDLDIRIPVGSFVNGGTYNLKVYLCDHLGNIVCYHFPFVLYCGSGIGGGGHRSQSAAEIEIPSVYRIVPNPANDKIIVAVHDVDPAKQRELRLLNPTGSLAGTVRLTAEAEIIDVSAYPPGVYIAVVLEDGLPVIVEKVAIVR